MSANLVQKLQELNGRLSEAERINYKLVLGLAAGGLAPDFDLPSADAQLKALATVQGSLARLQPWSERIPKNGVAYRGRPAFLAEAFLATQIAESVAIRPRAIRYENHFLATDAPIANRLALSPELRKLVETYAGPVQPTGVASFLYYEEPGQGIAPHIDTDIFSLNVILMLSHQKVDGRPSSLVVFPPDGEPERFILEPGEMVIMFAGSITHGREFVKPGESVSILTLGFHPITTA